MVQTVPSGSTCMCKHKTRTEFLSSKFIWNSQNCTTVLQSCTLFFLKKLKRSGDKSIDLINLYHSERIKLFILQFVQAVQARESYGTSIHPARKGAGRNGKKNFKCAGTMCAIKESCCNLVRSPSLSCAVHLPSASLLASTAPALADDLGVEAIRSRR